MNTKALMLNVVYNRSAKLLVMKTARPLQEGFSVSNVARQLKEGWDRTIGKRRQQATRSSLRKTLIFLSTKRSSNKMRRGNVFY